MSAVMRSPLHCIEQWRGAADWVLCPTHPRTWVNRVSTVTGPPTNNVRLARVAADGGITDDRHRHASTSCGDSVPGDPAGIYVQQKDASGKMFFAAQEVRLVTPSSQAAR